MNGESMEPRAPGTGEAKPVPLRRDKTPKAFWYDPDWPGHIMHRRPNATITAICVGHFHD